MKVSKRRLLALPILYLAALLCYTPSPAQTARVGIRKVVIDPGHGGQDPGCSYKQFKEKDIVLNVALRLGELIKDNFSDVEVIYTRKTTSLSRCTNAATSRTKPAPTCSSRSMSTRHAAVRPPEPKHSSWVWTRRDATSTSR